MNKVEISEWYDRSRIHFPFELGHYTRTVNYLCKRSGRASIISFQVIVKTSKGFGNEYQIELRFTDVDNSDKTLLTEDQVPKSQFEERVKYFQNYADKKIEEYIENLQTQS